MDNYNYLEGADLAIKNAADLLNAGATHAENQLVGLATSLTILSCEEAVKGLLCLRRHFHPDIPIHKFKDVFFKHEIKHHHIKEALNFMDQVLASFKETVPIIRETLDLSMQNNDPFAQQANKKFEDLTRYFETADLLPSLFVENPKKNLFNSDKVIAWWNEANNYKNDGLYVGKKNGSWKSPKDVDPYLWVEGTLYCGQLIEQAIAFKAVCFFREALGLIKTHPFQKRE